MARIGEAKESTAQYHKFIALSKVRMMKKRSMYLAVASSVLLDNLEMATLTKHDLTLLE